MSCSTCSNSDVPAMLPEAFVASQYATVEAQPLTAR
jgi:hypothetical protein